MPTVKNGHSLTLLSLAGSLNPSPPNSLCELRPTHNPLWASFVPEKGKVDSDANCPFKLCSAMLVYPNLILVFYQHVVQLQSASVNL